MILQYVLYLAVLVVLAISLGGYMKKVMNGEKNIFIRYTDTLGKGSI